VSTCLFPVLPGETILTILTGKRPSSLALP